MISYKRPPVPLTPRYSIPIEAGHNAVIPFDSPTGSKLAEAVLIGPPNAGKSTLINTILDNNISAVSDKAGTTDELKDFYFTKGLTQVKLRDTPGVITAHKLANSGHLITKCWESIPLADLTIFIVDAVKRIDPTVKKAVHRLSKIEVEQMSKEFMDAMVAKNADFNSLSRDYQENKQHMHKVPVNSILVMNKVDLVSNRRRFNYAKQELEDIGKFDYVFNVSAKTGYGVEELMHYIISQAKRKEWEVHPQVNTTQSEIEK